MTAAPAAPPRWPLAWALLLALGIAATLALVEAGTQVRYQHLPPAWLLASRAPTWAIVVLACQSVLVTIGILTHRHRLVPGRRLFTPLGLAVVIAGFVLTSATLSKDPVTYVAELGFASALQALHLGNLVLVVLALPAAFSTRVTRLLDAALGSAADTVPTPAAPDRFVWILAASVAVVAAFLAIVSYQQHPHIPDEVVYLIQARYLAEGRLTLPLPPAPDAFNVDLMMYQATRWFSPVPPGWPFILAAGTFLGATWLVNPILGGLNVVLAHSLLRHVYPARAARLATLFLALSPWGLFMAMSVMTHTATLTAALIAAISVARLRRGDSLGWGVIGGVAIGVVALIRPLEGLVVAGLLGVWSLGAVGRAWRLLPSAVLTLFATVTGALVLPYNAYLTGSARTFPIMAYTDATYGPGTNALGFGPNRGLGWEGLDPLPGHGLPDIFINANLNFFQVNTELLGWATGSMLPILLFLVLARWRRSDWLMLAALLAVVGIHSFYYFSGGPDFGARYWYLIIVPCVALAARGVEALGERLDDGQGPVLHGALILSLATLVLFVPWRAMDKYHHYRGMRPEARALATDPAMERGVILVQGNRHPDYASAMVYNPLTMEGNAPLFAWDRGAAVRRDLVSAFPDRQFWLVEGPTRSGDGYRVVAGPLSAAELLVRSDTLPPSP